MNIEPLSDDLVSSVIDPHEVAAYLNRSVPDLDKLLQDCDSEFETICRDAYNLGQEARLSGDPGIDFRYLFTQAFEANCNRITPDLEILFSGVSQSDADTTEFMWGASEIAQNYLDYWVSMGDSTAPRYERERTGAKHTLTLAQSFRLGLGYYPEFLQSRTDQAIRLLMAKYN